MTRTLSRRRFLQLGGGVAMGAVAAPLWLRPGGLFGVLDANATTTGNKLLVVLLAGGNDGLNTVIPYTDGTYYSKRTSDLTYAPAQVLPLTPALGLNPSLPTLKQAYDGGHCAVVLGVGYPDHDLSHFGSMDVWQSGSPTHAYTSGWLGRYLDLTPDGGSVVRAAAIGSSLPQALVGDRTSGVAVPSFGAFTFADGPDSNAEAARVHAAHLTCVAGSTTDPTAAAWLAGDNHAFQAVRAVGSLGLGAQPWPQSLGDQIAMAMSLLSSNLGCNIAFVTLGSFDDHAAEKNSHAQLLAELDQGIARFQSEVARTSNPAAYALMTFSEFGRRVEENGDGGTDHGTAAPLFVLGSKVKGGLYGAQPALDQLDEDGNLVASVDFREVYIPLIDNWLGGVSSQQVLGYSSSDGLSGLTFL